MKSSLLFKALAIGAAIVTEHDRQERQRFERRIQDNLTDDELDVASLDCGLDPECDLEPTAVNVVNIINVDTSYANRLDYFVDQVISNERFSVWYDGFDLEGFPMVRYNKRKVEFRKRRITIHVRYTGELSDQEIIRLAVAQAIQTRQVAI